MDILRHCRIRGRQPRLRRTGPKQRHDTYTDARLSKASSRHHPKWHEVSLEADYFLSKRTDVYLQGTFQQIAADGSGLMADISGQALSSTNRQAVVAAGMRHRF
jgi:GBP family porin